MLKNISVLLLLVLSVFSSKAQTIKSFTSDPVKFLQEMESFLEETDKKEGQKLMEEFTPVWNSGKFSAQQQEAIYHTANGMLKKRMKAFPDFRNYIQALIGFAGSNQPPQSFTSWQTSLDKLLLLPSRYFTNYINTCNSLFRSNSLYDSPSVNWHTDNNNYTFEFDSLPKIIFPSMTLICSTKGDSSVIYQTKGTLYPTRQLFYGSGGKVNWVRAGWDQNIVRAELSNYVIDVTGSDFSADSVTFFNSTYFKTPLQGKYTDKILANVSTENASYPRFNSYSNSFVIKNIVPDVDYSGGFTMQGNRMIGSGTSDQLASITFYRDKKAFLVSRSRSLCRKKRPDYL